MFQILFNYKSSACSWLEIEIVLYQYRTTDSAYCSSPACWGCSRLAPVQQSSLKIKASVDFVDTPYFVQSNDYFSESAVFLKQ